jgi:hypothetical protein
MASPRWRRYVATVKKMSVVMALKLRRTPRIGDGVRPTHPANEYSWRGTVVDVFDDEISTLYRVYWRYPNGKVANYRENEIKRV